MLGFSFFGTWLMFTFLIFFWRSAISTIRLSTMFINGDAGAGFFNACTSLFNAIVEFYDADLNDTAYLWESNSPCLISLPSFFSGITW